MLGTSVGQKISCSNWLCRHRNITITTFITSRGFLNQNIQDLTNNNNNVGRRFLSSLQTTTNNFSRILLLQLVPGGGEPATQQQPSTTTTVITTRFRAASSTTSTDTTTLERRTFPINNVNSNTAIRLYHHSTAAPSEKKHQDLNNDNSNDDDDDDAGQQLSPLEETLTRVLNTTTSAKTDPPRRQRRERTLAEQEERLRTIYHHSSKELSFPLIYGLLKECINAKSYEGAETAERLVLEWVLLFYRSNRFNALQSNNVFGMALQAWVTSGHPSSGTRAEQLLNKLQDLYYRRELPWPVDTPIYNTVMKAYAIHGDYQNVQVIFDMCQNDFLEYGNESARPTVFTWAILIDSYVKSNNPDAIKDIENLLDEMQSQYQQGILQEPPNSHIYSIILNGYAKVGDFQKATQLFVGMMQDYKTNGNEAAKPTPVIFRGLLQTYHTANLPQAGEFADAILEQMKQEVPEYMPPERGDLILMVKCWRCTLGHDHSDPKAHARVKELNVIINQMGRGRKEKSRRRRTDKGQEVVANTNNKN